MKKIISTILITVLLMSVCSILSVNAIQKDNIVKFDNIDEVNRVVNDVFEKNYDELVAYAKKVRPSISEPDEYITFYSNCGPCSYGFQRILYDNGIVAENQKRSVDADHIYNFLRISYNETPNEVTGIVVDTTFKQYLTEYYTQEKGLTFDDL